MNEILIEKLKKMKDNEKENEGGGLKQIEMQPPPPKQQR